MNLAGELIHCRHHQDRTTAHDRQVEPGNVVRQGESVGGILAAPRRYLCQDGDNEQGERVQATDELASVSSNRRSVDWTPCQATWICSESGCCRIFFR